MSETLAIISLDDASELCTEAAFKSDMVLGSIKILDNQLTSHRAKFLVYEAQDLKAKLKLLEIYFDALEHAEELSKAETIYTKAIEHQKYLEQQITVAKEEAQITYDAAMDYSKTPERNRMRARAEKA